MKKTGKNKTTSSAKTIPREQKRIHQPNPPYTKRKFFVISLIAVLFITAITYAGSLTNGFINNWDDNIYILKNPFFNNFSWLTLKNIFFSFYQANYHPLTLLSYCIDHALWGLKPLPFHVINQVLHLFNVLLVFRLFQLLTKRLEIAVIVAVLFGIHPMHVESVAWISERKDVLYAFFYLAALISYVYYLNGKGKYLYLVVSFVLFLLSLLSKSMAVTLPVLMLLLDYQTGRKRSMRWLIEKIPFFTLSLLFGILAIKSQAATKAFIDIAPIFSIGQRFLIICHTVMFYFIKLFAPFGLSALYYYPTESGKAALDWQFYAAPFALIALVFLIRKSKTYRKDFIFGFLFFLVTISVVLQFSPVGQALAADRYTYIPYLGLFFILGRLYTAFADKEIKINQGILNGVKVFFVLLILMFVVTSWQRIKVWKDGITLFTDDISHNPKMFYSYYVRAEGYMQSGKPDLDAALKDYSRCIELKPDYTLPYKGRGNVLYKQQRFNEALNDFNTFLSMEGNDAEGYSDRGATRFGLGDWKGTITDCTHALGLDPSISAAWINRGNAKGMLADYKGSVEDYNEAIIRDPSQSGAFLNRGISWMALGRMNEACSDWKIAQEMGNNNADGLISKNCK